MPTKKKQRLFLPRVTPSEEMQKQEEEKEKSLLDQPIVANVDGKSMGRFDDIILSSPNLVQSLGTEIGFGNKQRLDFPISHIKAYLEELPLSQLQTIVGYMISHSDPEQTGQKILPFPDKYKLFHKLKDDESGGKDILLDLLFQENDHILETAYQIAGRLRSKKTIENANKSSNKLVQTEKEKINIIDYPFSFDTSRNPVAHNQFSTPYYTKIANNENKRLMSNLSVDPYIQDEDKDVYIEHPAYNINHKYYEGWGAEIVPLCGQEIHKHYEKMNNLIEEDPEIKEEHGVDMDEVATYRRRFCPINQNVVDATMQRYLKKHQQ